MDDDSSTRAIGIIGLVFACVGSVVAVLSLLGALKCIVGSPNVRRLRIAFNTLLHALRARPALESRLQAVVRGNKKMETFVGGVLADAMSEARDLCKRRSRLEDQKKNVEARRQRWLSFSVAGLGSNETMEQLATEDEELALVEEKLAEDEREFEEKFSQLLAVAQKDIETWSTKLGCCCSCCCSEIENRYNCIQELLHNPVPDIAADLGPVGQSTHFP